MATAPFTTEATMEMTSPIPTLSSGRGLRKRSTAETRITAAATKIIIPSIAAEKYSALVRP